MQRFLCHSIACESSLGPTTLIDSLELCLRLSNQRLLTQAEHRPNPFGVISAGLDGVRSSQVFRHVHTSVSMLCLILLALAWKFAGVATSPLTHGSDNHIGGASTLALPCLLPLSIMNTLGRGARRVPNCSRGLSNVLPCSTCLRRNLISGQCHPLINGRAQSTHFAPILSPDVPPQTLLKQHVLVP